MKKHHAFALVVALASMASAAQAANLAETLNQAALQQWAGDVRATDLINWKVGDNADYDVSAGSFGKMGTMHMGVTKDEGSSIWVSQEAQMMGQDDKSEMQMSKSDGKVLKFIHNGKEEAIPDDKITPTNQEYTEVTVPAGTFKAIHITATTSNAQIKQIDIWANPKDTVMSGMIKQVMDTGQMVVTVELTKFAHGN